MYHTQSPVLILFHRWLRSHRNRDNLSLFTTAISLTTPKTLVFSKFSLPHRSTDTPQRVRERKEGSSEYPRRSQFPISTTTLCHNSSTCCWLRRKQRISDIRHQDIRDSDGEQRKPPRLASFDLSRFKLATTLPTYILLHVQNPSRPLLPLLNPPISPLTLAVACTYV